MKKKKSSKSKNTEYDDITIIEVNKPTEEQAKEKIKGISTYINNKYSKIDKESIYE